MNANEHERGTTEAGPPPSERWSFAAVILIPIILYWVTWPLRNVVLTVWIYGLAGYQRGIRILPGKPIKFTTGDEAPTLPDVVTGFGAFLLAASLSFAVIYIAWRITRRYVRHH